MLGDMIPDLVGPGLCFVGKTKDPAIITRHLGAPESVSVRWRTTKDIADIIRGKVWHCTIQQMAGIVQGDDYGRNTLGKRKRNNGPIQTWLIDFGWAGFVPKEKIQDVLYIQLVGFFIEFIHLNYPDAAPLAKDMMLKALDIITSGRRVMRLSPLRPYCMVPDWEYVRVWRKVYPETDHDFISQRGSNCKPKPNLMRMENIYAIKRKLLELADRGYKKLNN